MLTLQCDRHGNNLLGVLPSEESPVLVHLRADQAERLGG